MSWTLSEGLVDAVKTELSSSLPAKLDALDTEYGDGIVLDDPESYYIAEPSIESVHGTTAVLILADDWTAGPGDYSAGGCLNPTHTLRVEIITTDSDAEQLKRRVYRYVRAILEVLDAAHATGGLSGFGPTGSIAPEYSSIRADGSQLVADARLTLGYIKAEQKA